MNSRKFGIICAILLVFLLMPVTGCSDSTDINNNQSVYDGLSDAQKEEVDFIIAHVVPTQEDSGFTFDCVQIKVSSKSGGSRTVQLVYMREGSDFVIDDHYDCNASNKKFSLNFSGVGPNVGNLYVRDWDNSWDTEQKRDYLAKKIKK